MTFTPKEVILGATVPLENGSTITFSVAGHVEAERDIDDAVVIFARKLLKYTNCAADADRLTVRQVVSSITSAPLDKVPDVGASAPAPGSAKPAPASKIEVPAGEIRGKTGVGKADPAVARLDEPETSAPVPNPEPIPPTPAAKPGEEICERCGCSVSKSQANLSKLFLSKTVCKSCMDVK